MLFSAAPILSGCLVCAKLPTVRFHLSQQIRLAHSFCVVVFGRFAGTVRTQMIRKATGYMEVEAMMGNLAIGDQALLKRIGWYKEQQRIRDGERLERLRKKRTS